MCPHRSLCRPAVPEGKASQHSVLLCMDGLSFSVLSHVPLPLYHAPAVFVSAAVGGAQFDPAQGSQLLNSKR